MWCGYFCVCSLNEKIINLMTEKYFAARARGVPFCLFHMIPIFNNAIRKGRLYCKLSTISIKSPHTRANDAIVGIVTTKSIVTKLYNSRSFDCKILRASWLSGGHKPMIFNMSRFMLVAHSKSVIKSFDLIFDFLKLRETVETVSLHTLLAYKTRNVSIYWWRMCWKIVFWHCILSRYISITRNGVIIIFFTQSVKYLVNS